MLSFLKWRNHLLSLKISSFLLAMAADWRFATYFWIIVVVVGLKYKRVLRVALFVNAMVVLFLKAKRSEVSGVVSVPLLQT
jgi:hypothetical protein